MPNKCTVQTQKAYHLPFSRGDTPGPLKDHSAEGKGFEPLVRGYRTLVFKTSSIGRSDNLPH
jgi:hypothetical protein